MFPEQILTDRLKLRRLSRKTINLFEFYQICSADEEMDEVTQYLTWDPHQTPKETRDYLISAEEGWENGDVATYGVYPREGEPNANELAGDTGITINWEKQTALLGVWFRKRFWGRGYSGERAAALSKLAFDRLDLDLLSVVHYPQNVKSKRAIETYIERLGGQREGLLRNYRVDADGTPRDAVRYTVSQAEWIEATDDGNTINADMGKMDS